jgi:hypothetical protein
MSAEELFIELLQIAIGRRQQLSEKPSSKKWLSIYGLANEQAVAGVCIAGVDKLPKEQMPPEMMLLEWIGQSEQIRQQNSYLDKLTAQIWKRLSVDGLDVVILKGQGLAQEYEDLASMRQSGDIDVWILGGFQTVCDYVQKTIPTDDLTYHHFHYPYYEDIQVELHHRPTILRNLIRDRKFAKWYNGFKSDQFLYLEDKQFAVPSPAFNRIFVLAHMYRHFLFEGIGMRQILDYYFVLQNSEKPDNEVKMLVELGLTTFAGAVSWILNTQLGLEKNKLIWLPNKQEGHFLLNEIFKTGNLGHADGRYNYKHLRVFRRLIGRGAHLLIHYPSEILWTPIWLVFHKFWKRARIRELKKVGNIKI